MKASLKMITSVCNAQGHPVTLFLVDGKKRFKRKLFDCHLQYWDQVNNTVLSSHPEYRLLISELLNYQSKIKQVNYNSFTFNQAKTVLFESSSNKRYFNNLASKYVDESSTGKLYRTVLNSFMAFAADVYLEDITNKMAHDYLKAILKTMSANGAHAYLRTLNALFNKCSDLPNPFKGVRPKKVKTAAKDLNDTDLKKLIYTRTIKKKSDYKNTNDTVNNFRYYFMLMFYLGGIDLIDLSKLRYDTHLVDGRIQFYRSKGGTNAFVNNKVFDCAYEILQRFDCYPYLVPIYKYANYKDFSSNMNRRFVKQVKDLKLNKKPLTKSARYSFINRAQQLLIDERITMELVGHVQQSVHSIYTNEFPLKTRDEAHFKIIDLPI